MHLTAVERLEAERSIAAIRERYACDAPAVFAAIAEMVVDGELTSGAELVAALNALLEDDDDDI